MRDLLSARLVESTPLSEDVTLFTFEAVEAAFVACAAGAHVDVHLPNGLIRNYSLTDWDPAGRRVSVAVKLEPAGRGGSVAMHALQTGSVLQISQPRNTFALRDGDEPIVLIGGGIGITPLYAMACLLRSAARPFEVHYLVRTRQLAAFDDGLRALALGDSYRLHCDDTDGLPEFQSLLKAHPSNTHYYVCGPEVMLAAVQQASEDLQRGTIFFERFSAVPQADSGPRESFRVAVRSTGEEFDVPAEKSILEVLRTAGHDVDYACSEGACGTCITDVLEGEIDHRDSILTDEERADGDCMCICVSRARCARLVLDL